MATEMQRLAFRERFRSVFGEEFQAWLSPLLRALHGSGDFQKIRKTSGDGGIDGFVIESQQVYAMYAPRTLSELRDSETARKIRQDFESARGFLGDKLKVWTFIHNDPQAAIGKEMAKVLAELQSANLTLRIEVLNIDSLWDRLGQLPTNTLSILFGAATTLIEPSVQAGVLVGMDGPVPPQHLATGEQTATRRRIELRLQTAAQTILAEEIPETNSLSAQNERRFNRARSELLNGSIPLAERDYRTLIEDLESGDQIANRLLLFRSYTNLGAALWGQGKREEAVSWYEKGASLMPEEPKAQINIAVCQIHRRKYDEAVATLTKHCAERGETAEALYLLAQVFAEQGKNDKAVELLEAKPRDGVDYFIALAETYLRSDLFHKAQSAAEKALSFDHNSASALTILAWSKGFPFLARPKSKRPHGPESPEDRKQVYESIDTADKAIKILRARGKFQELSDALTNFGALNGLVGRTDLAEQSAREAAAILPSNRAALNNLWYSLICNEKFAEAFNITQEIALLDPVDGKLRALDTLGAWGEPQRLIDESEKTSSAEISLKQSFHWFEARAEAYMELNDEKKAFAEIESGLGLLGNEPRLLALRASFSLRLNRTEQALDDIKAAGTLAPDDSMILLRASRILARCNQFAAAKDRLRRLGAQNIHSPLFEQYLIILYNLKEFSVCQTIAEEAIADSGKFNPILYDIAARSAYSANDLVAAKNHFETLLSKSDSKKVEAQTALAQVYSRLDENEKALTILEQAFARAPKNLNVLLGLTSVLTALKQNKKAINYALLAVKVSPKSHRAHQALVNASMGHKQISLTQQQKSAIKKSFEFLTKAGTFRTIEIDKELTALKGLLETQANRSKKLEELAEQRRVPMGMLAGMLGQSIFDFWTTLRAHPKIQIFFQTGSVEEQIEEAKTTEIPGAVCVDITALFTLALTGHLQLLPKLGESLLIHSSALEEVANTIQRHERLRPNRSIAYDENKIINVSVPDEIVDQWLKLLREIRDFLKSTDVRLVGFSYANLSPKDSDVRQALGSLSYDSIGAAFREKACYYSDDALLRSLAQSMYETKGFGTQAALRAFKSRGLISEADYQDAILLLIANNYHFVSDDAGTLLHLARKEKLRPSNFSKRILRRLAAVEMNPETSAAILANFISVIWKCDFSHSEATREDWIDIATDILTTAPENDVFSDCFFAKLGLFTFFEPEIFGGITGRMLRSASISDESRDIIFAQVQGTIHGMREMVKRQSVDFMGLSDRWTTAGRLNLIFWRKKWF